MGATPSVHWSVTIAGARPSLPARRADGRSGLEARAPTASLRLRHNYAVRATGARPSGRRNARPQRPFQTTRTRTTAHRLVSQKNCLEIRSPQTGPTLLRPEGRAPTELLRLRNSLGLTSFATFANGEAPGESQTWKAVHAPESEQAVMLRSGAEFPARWTLMTALPMRIPRAEGAWFGGKNLAGKWSGRRESNPRGQFGKLRLYH